MVFFDSLKVEEKKKKDLSDPETVFVFSGLPSTMATTLGSFIRRLAITCVPGVAVCGVKILDKNGVVKTKVSPVDGVDKNAFELILFLKDILFVEKKDLPLGDFFFFTLKINNSTDAEKEVKAGDFIGFNKENELDDSVIISNSDLVLFTLAPSSFIEIKLYCKKSWGYSPDSKNEKYLLKLVDENVIPLDADYCPVKSYFIFPKVEKEVISLIEEEEKLVLRINNSSSFSRDVLKKTIDIALNIFNKIKAQI